MDFSTESICSFIFSRQVHGHPSRVRHLKVQADIFLRRDDHVPSTQENHSTWPVGSWMFGQRKICVLFHYEGNREFMEDVQFYGHDLGAAVKDLLNMYRPLNEENYRQIED